MIATDSYINQMTDRLGEPLKMGDTVYASILHDDYYVRHRFASLDELIIVGAPWENTLKLAETVAFNGQERHTYSINPKNCIKKIK